MSRPATTPFCIVSSGTHVPNAQGARTRPSPPMLVKKECQRPGYSAGMVG